MLTRRLVWLLGSLGCGTTPAGHGTNVPTPAPIITLALEVRGHTIGVSGAASGPICNGELTGELVITPVGGAARRIEVRAPVTDPRCSTCSPQSAPTQCPFECNRGPFSNWIELASHDFAVGESYSISAADVTLSCAPGRLRIADAKVQGGGIAAPPPPAPPRRAAIGCGPDQLLDTICGSVAPPNVAGHCGPMGDSLTSFGQSYVVSWSTTPPVRREFALDDAATAAYRRSLSATLPADNYCCYSQCSQLAVAPTAPAPRPRPKYHIEDRCIPPPSATTMPSKPDPSCPAAVELSGERLPYRASVQVAGGEPSWFPQATTARCCYSAVVPDPLPRNRGSR